MVNALTSATCFCDQFKGSHIMLWHLHAQNLLSEQLRQDFMQLLLVIISWNVSSTADLQWAALQFVNFLKCHWHIDCVPKELAKRNIRAVSCFWHSSTSPIQLSLFLSPHKPYSSLINTHTWEAKQIIDGGVEPIVNFIFGFCMMKIP